MRVGIDFGTTRIVVAAADRGNYPVVAFETPEGGTEEWFSPLVAVSGDKRLYGWEAFHRQGDREWTVLRSLKRLLEDAGPNTSVEVGGQPIPLLDLLRGLLETLRHDLFEHSSMPETSGHRLEAMIGVPANANSNQRFLTAEAFRLAGFDVLGVLNEPSAASIEFGHRNKKDAQKKKLLLVYDLGGGTFDASLVEHDEQTHTVLASDGITTLGGDDFDYVLAELALSAAGLSKGKITDSELFRLLEECRRKKESLHPNTRKLAVDLDCVREGWPEISLPVAQFYEEARPYVEETIDTVRGLLDRQGHAAPDCLYITGGGSELPLVARRLKEEFGRRVKRSAYTRSATAIGLAIQADAASGYELRDKFTRYFGVWREAEAGRRIIFDPLFEKGAPLPGTGERALEITRRYRPVHNIGHLRYLECSHVAGDQPGGDITFWDEIRFALDPALHRHASVEGLPVEYSQRAAEQDIEEVYRCDAAGIVHVTIRNLSAGYEQTWHLGRWSVRTKPVTLARKRRAAAHSIES